MPTAIWTGSLSLGMVVVPVRLYAAIRKKTMRFHELDPGGRRVRHVRVSERDAELDPGYRGAAPRLSDPHRCQEQELSLQPQPRDQAPPTFQLPIPEVPFEKVRKGFEIAPGEYVSMTRDEVSALAPERSRVIDVEQFVDVSAVDPIYFESRYYVVPDREWSSPF